MGEQPRELAVASKLSVTCKEALCLVFLGSKSLDTLQTPSQRLKASIFVAISWCQLRTVRQCRVLQNSVVLVSAAAVAVVAEKVMGSDLKFNSFVSLFCRFVSSSIPMWRPFASCQFAPARQLCIPLMC